MFTIFFLHADTSLQPRVSFQTGTGTLLHLMLVLYTKGYLRSAFLDRPSPLVDSLAFQEQIMS